MVDEMKLDFKDVLIKPQLTTLYSRSQVQLERTFKFPFCNQEWTGIPIMSANMDTTGTLETAEALAQHKLMTCLHKHYTVEEVVNWGKRVGKSVLNNVAVTAGVSDRDLDKVKQIL